MKHILLYTFLFCLPTLADAQAAKTIDFKDKLKAITNSYFMAYNDHNIDRMLLFYDDSAVLIDKTLDHSLQGPKEFRRVATEAFNGPSPVYKNLRFKVFGMEQDDYKVTVKGEMQGIEWNRGYLSNWKFRSEIFYNEMGKIIKQVDYIDYPQQVISDANRYGKKNKN